MTSGLTTLHINPTADKGSALRRKVFPHNVSFFSQRVYLLPRIFFEKGFTLKGEFGGDQILSFQSGSLFRRGLKNNFDIAACTKSASIIIELKKKTTQSIKLNVMTQRNIGEL